MTILSTTNLGGSDKHSLHTITPLDEEQSPSNVILPDVFQFHLSPQFGQEP
ncbi:hypothetical protein HN375_01285 [bacterium]|nr:hypothetical protein [bacterium]